MYQGIGNRPTQRCKFFYPAHGNLKAEVQIASERKFPFFDPYIPGKPGISSFLHNAILQRCFSLLLWRNGHEWEWFSPNHEIL
jgi:hypothetical protein